MANHLRGEIDITLGEETYKCKLNFDSLVRIESNLNIPIIQLANKISEANLKMSEISFIIYTAIKGGGKNISEKDVNSLIWKAGIIEGLRACGEIVTMALSSGDDEKKS